MNVKAMVAGVVVIGIAGVANASIPTYTLDWLVNGQNSVVVNEGEQVVVTAIASWSPSALGIGSNLMRVELANADASDGLQYSEAMGMGRNPLLRMLPQAFVDGVIAGGRNITATGGGVIDAAQMPQMMNPMFTTANPVEVFRFVFTAGEAGRVIGIDSPLQSVSLYSNAMGVPTAPYLLNVDGASIQIVPAPGAAALLGLGGALCLRRRR